MHDFLNVNQVLSNLDLRDSMVAAEFGCGSAAFAIALAKKLNRGRVYALDIQEEKLSALRGKISHEKIKNIFTVRCDLESQRGSTLQENTQDVVLITNILFQSENKYTIIQEAARILKKGGQILVIEWLKENPLAAKETIMTPGEVKTMAQKAGLAVQREFAVGDHRFGMVLVK